MRFAFLVSTLCLLPASLHAAGGALTKDEAAQLQRSVDRCWNTGALSAAAGRTSITLRLAMTPDRVPVMDSIELTETDGDAAATQEAFLAARRAILRCGQKGLALPEGKYELWRELHLTFDMDGTGL